MFYNFTVCLPEDENTGRCRLPSSFFSTRNSVNSWVRITTCSSILYCRAWPLTHTDSTNIVQADSTTSIPTESNLEPGTCQVDFITEKISPLKSLEIEIIESKTSFKTITLYLIGKLVSKDAIVSLTIPNLETRVKLTSEFGVITSSTKISLKQVNKVLYNPINIPPGLEAQFESLNQVIAFPLIYARLFEKLNVKPQKGVLVSGPAGVGKTSLITAIIEIHGLKLITLNGPDIYSSQLGESESKLREIFSQAESTPGTDALAPTRTINNDHENRVVAQLLVLMDGINSSNLVVIGATNRPNSIDPALRRPGRFDREIFIDPPNDIQRAAILKHSCRKLNIDIDFNEIGKLTNGFVGADLVFLSHLIGQIKIKQDNVSNQDVIDCIKKCSPSLQRNSMTTESFDLSWDDIGGVDQVKKKLLQIIEWPFKYAESFKRLGITSARGVLLYGPPGCSKTSLVKIIAKNSGATFFSLNGAQIYNAYLGESEKTIKDVFSRARLASPSIIFLDEIDAIVGKRGSTGGGVSERILSTLLNEMDGIEAMVGVLVVGATNRLDMVDDALKRPGRFDCIVQVPLPDLESRIKIFKVHTRGMKTVDVDFQELASETDGMSGAQIANICREAAMNALREDIKADHVTMSHFRMNGLEKKFKSLAI